MAIPGSGNTWHIILWLIVFHDPLNASTHIVFRPAIIYNCDPSSIRSYYCMHFDFII